MIKSFIKRVKYWLIARQTPVEEGDSFVIPFDILFEANTGTYYSKETPTATVLSTNPRGNVHVNANTNIIIDFKPSGPAPVTTIRVSIKEPPLESHPLFNEFLRERGLTLEKWQNAKRTKWGDPLCKAFRKWLTKKSASQQ